MYKAINEDSSYVGALDLKPKGNLGNYLDDLREHVVPYKNISLAFALGVSSSIVAKLNMHYKDINTLLVHLFAESTKGKSTAAMLAISVWGNQILVEEVYTILGTLQKMHYQHHLQETMV